MLNPAEFLEKYTEIGEKKASSGVKKLLLAGILAGFAIGIGSAVTAAASYSVESASIAKLISGVLFPLGLIMVLMTGAELFTGNCLMLISIRERRIRVGGMVRNLVLVYLGNFVGSVLLAWALRTFSGPHMADGLVLKMISTAAAKCSFTFIEALGLGILCNILVCTAVMMALCAEDSVGRAVGVFGPVCCFVICGFEHCVANMYYIPAGLLALTLPGAGAVVTAAGLDISALTWGNFLLGNLLPVTIGNLLGGLAFAWLLWSAHHKKSA
ncbi:formate/nitrite transporter family protein [uncultured Oscillibacter sp.]|uniref:formate/nitrite transporter family protein n=1 Tax=uncultured Oscillibacter sp. TaxID=876091 RepID=UPI0025D26C8D|nr:formate/nitrite transporter family protein [uncultured Oscillibacter sp.]